MEQQVCAITGCNSGIGKETAKILATKGFEILMLVRDSQKSRAAFEEIQNVSGSSKIKLYYVDLSDIASIRQVAARIKQEHSKIDILINNAGVFTLKEKYTADGFEMMLGVNYIAPFLLTNLLLPLLKKAPEARVINVGSLLYKRGRIYLDQHFVPENFKVSSAYANSKLLLMYFTKELAERLKGTRITVNCLHPGIVGSGVSRDFPEWMVVLFKWMITKPEKGAGTSVFLATSASVAHITGQYFARKKIRRTARIANDRTLSVRIWDKTNELL